ncbi:MAG: 1-acyl-sn-glycerol-3-phosphate acyltransferase, partial [Flavobacteriaceae bacterium]|nr:1-acyl-sn-glycerol-3-phosphate acyltransferase [Flavobacteriaceae bacterium]
PIFYKIAHYWAKTTLFAMGFSPKVFAEEKIISNKSYMLCPNHTSAIDIFLILAITKNPFVFIGKKELGKIPVFGYIYKRTCILVDRNDVKSRRNAFNEAQKRLQRGLSICIFPEGKVPDDESIILDEFQKGAFRLAIEFQIPIVPHTFYDCKKRFSYTFFSGSPGTLRVKMHNLIKTIGLAQEDKDILKEETYQIIYSDLVNDMKQVELATIKTK